MLGLRTIGSASIGSASNGAEAGADVVIVAAWTEQPDIVAVSVLVSSLVTAVISYTEQPDVISITASVGALAASIGWTEAPDVISAEIIVATPDYARAPDGGGFVPQPCGRQNRPPALQGYCK